MKLLAPGSPAQIQPSAESGEWLDGLVTQIIIGPANELSYTVAINAAHEVFTVPAPFVRAVDGSKFGIWTPL